MTASIIIASVFITFFIVSSFDLPVILKKSPVYNPALRNAGWNMFYGHKRK